MTHTNKIFGIVPAAGVGKRMQANCPKQYLQINDSCVIERTLSRLLEADVFNAISVAITQGDPYWPELEISRHPKIITAPGGKERVESVLLALNALTDKASDQDWVLVHDAARPCITASDIRLLIDTLTTHEVGGILALPSFDTLKSVEVEDIQTTIDRSQIWRALTPQMFHYGALKDAINEALDDDFIVTDEASAMERKGLKPKIVEGRPDNIKITRPEDLALAQFYLERQ